MNVYEAEGCGVESDGSVGVRWLSQLSQMELRMAARSVGN